jgi:RimJ/RimL family protein N-acetyltransferase
VELRDDVVLLRPFVDDDASAVAAACADSEIARFIPMMPHPYTEADARAYLATVAENREAQKRFALAVTEVASGRLVGSIDVRLGDVGSIGCWTAAEARGRGVATRALRLLSRWAVTEGGVERLELATHPENRASQRVAEKAGFAKEGVLRSHTRFREGRRDSVLYSLLPSDLD